jgi:signal-transduction protein with cAMP-binding, CBS, and nucleotidyltransferase domain
MSTPLVSGAPQSSSQEILEKMRASAIRRVPILSDGQLVGIVTLDDLLGTLGHRLTQLTQASRRGERSQRNRARIERTRARLDEHTQLLRERLGLLGSRAAALGRRGTKLVQHRFEALRRKLGRQQP